MDVARDGRVTGMDEAERESLIEAIQDGEQDAWVERILAAHVAAARAEAWDEGYDARVRFCRNGHHGDAPSRNPYLLPENRETTPATMSPEQARRILARSKPTEIRTPDGPSIRPTETP